MSNRRKAPEALYFDSNILRKAGWPDPSARLLELVNRATIAGVVPAMVDLVRRELVEGWIRDLARDRRSLVDKAKEYSRRTFGLAKHVEPAPLPPPEQLREHIAKVTEKLAQRFRLVPTTNQPAATFMDLAMRRGGAFVEGGKGFNDTVILLSIVEDMTAHGLDAAILVSEDHGFQGVGMKQVTGDKELLVLTSLEAVDQLLTQLLSDRIDEHIKETKFKVISGVRAHESDLREFLRQKLPSVADELTTVDKVRQAELLGIIDYVDAHSVPFLLGQKNREKNRFSVDVRIKVRLETQSILFERRLERIDTSPFAIHPEDIIISTTEREAVVTVEGSAEVTKAGIQAVHFSGVRVKKGPVGLGDLLVQGLGQ